MLRNILGKSVRDHTSFRRLPILPVAWYLSLLSRRRYSPERRPPKPPSVRTLLERAQESNKKLDEVRYCSGTYDLTSGTGSIAYRKKPTGLSDKQSRTGWIDFSSPNLNEAQLEELVDACDAATFGRGDEDILDASYRKAWKLDASRFAAQFDLGQSGILEAVHGELLRFNDNSVRIDAQLYKLNVYGPGSHFKSHVDTPRSDKMFGSLVVVFPTEHIGGDLTLSDASGHEQVRFESSKMLSKGNEADKTLPPRLAWIAFYSDVKHKVTPVESGYRVSLTYNLYHSQDLPNANTPVISLPHPEASDFRSALKKLLDSPDVLPGGGALGFGLTHKYPLFRNINDLRDEGTLISPVLDMLTGSDALVKRICTELSLECHVKGMYNICHDLMVENDDFSMDHISYYKEETKYHVYLTDVALSDGWYDDSVGDVLNKAPNLRVIDVLDGNPPQRPKRIRESTKLAPVVSVLWVTPASKLGAIQSSVQGTQEAWDDELCWVYARLTLVAMVPPFAVRGQTKRAM